MFNNPLIIPILIFMIPIIAILTSHQRKMAELKIGKVENNNEGVKRELVRMQAEIERLKHQLNDQAIQIDSLASYRMTPPPMSDERIRERLNQ